MKKNSAKANRVKAKNKKLASKEMKARAKKAAAEKIKTAAKKRPKAIVAKKKGAKASAAARA